LNIDYVARREGVLNSEHYNLWLIASGKEKDPVLSKTDAEDFLKMFPPRKNIQIPSNYLAVFSEK